MDTKQAIGPRHPEQLPEEIYLCNDDYPGFLSDGSSWWKTGRYGLMAIDRDGRVLPSSYGIFPVFILRSEVEEQIERARRLGSQDTARALEVLLKRDGPWEAV